MMLLLSAFVEGCASQRPPAPGSTYSLVTYQTYPGPYCGRCDSTTIEVWSDGQVWVEDGHWLWNKFWRTRRRHIQIPQEGLSAFRKSLDPYRPAETLVLEGLEACGEHFVPDQPGVLVRWREDSKVSILHYNYACYSPQAVEMREAIATAPFLLGITDLTLPYSPGPAPTSR